MLNTTSKALIIIFTLHFEYILNLLLWKNLILIVFGKALVNVLYFMRATIENTFYFTLSWSYSLEFFWAMWRVQPQLRTLHPIYPRCWPRQVLSSTAINAHKALVDLEARIYLPRSGYVASSRKQSWPMIRHNRLKVSRKVSNLIFQVI